MKKLSFVIVLSGTALLLSACASKQMPTFGEELMSRSSEANSISKDWSAGEKLAVKGAKALAEADEKQAESDELQKEIFELREKGSKWSAEGAAKKVDAEARYRALRAQPIAHPAPAASQ